MSSDQTSQTTTAPPSLAARLGAGVSCVVGLLFLGVMGGGLLGGRVFGSGMGIDRLADALGGAAIGIVVGLLASIWAIRRLVPRQQVWTGSGALLAGIVALAVMQALAS